MAKKTQGTNLYLIDPDNGDVLVVGCVTSISGLTSPIDQVEVTCLESLAREYVAGMATPGQAQFGINFDPDDDSHARLLELKQAGEVLEWAIGWSDGTAPPTAPDTSGFTLPATRSWLTFDGFITDVPFDFSLNSVVQSTVALQVSGEVVLTRKTA